MQDLVALPPQPARVPWPTEVWPVGDPDVGRNRLRLERLIEQAFGTPSSDHLGATDAVLVVQAGRLVFERYGQGCDARTLQRSWSMAKSITHALVGILVADGMIDIRAPADVPEWRNDERATITLDHLLRMSSGLDWAEDQAPGRPWDTQVMLFGEGQADMAAYAARAGLAHAPGTYFSYSSGSTNIVSRCLARALGVQGRAFRDFMRARLFEPIGMTTPVPRWDGAGTFIGSSFCRASARDFARLGLLYLRDGVWRGRRLLPEGWVDYARTPTYQQPGCDAPGRYGAHWWLDFGGPGSFSANGFEGQYIVCAPDLDLVLVRHGVTPPEQMPALNAWLGEVIDCYRA